MSNHHLTAKFGIAPTGIFIICVLLLSAQCRSSAEAPEKQAKIIRQIDHIKIASSEARALFSLFADNFQLPLAWPMASYGGFASGGFFAGNVNIEIIADAGSVAKPQTGIASFTGFALEPEPLQTSLRELRARSIPHGHPSPFKAMQSGIFKTTLWTTVALPEVSSETAEVFICEYTHDVAAKRRSLLERLRSSDGGPLTVQSVEEIEYGAEHLNRMKQSWHRLLAPGSTSTGDVFSLGPGPAIRLVEARKDGIQGIVIKVKSLSKAGRFLSAHGLLGKEEPTRLTLGGAQLHGLRITLIGPASEGQ